MKKNQLPTLAAAYARICQDQTTETFFQIAVGLNLNISQTEVGDNVKVEFLDDRSTLFIVDAEKFDDDDEPVKPTFLVLGQTQADTAFDIADEYPHDELEQGFSRHNLNCTEVQEVAETDEIEPCTIYYFEDGSRLTIRAEEYREHPSEQFIVWPE